MRVLIESRDGVSDLWFVDYEGEAIKETANRYLVRHHFILRSWIPKKGYLMRCEEINELV